MSTPRLWESVLNLVLVALLAIAVFWPTGDRKGAAFLCDVGHVHAQQGQISIWVIRIIRAMPLLLSATCLVALFLPPLIKIVLRRHNQIRQECPFHLAKKIRDLRIQTLYQ